MSLKPWHDSLVFKNGTAKPLRIMVERLVGGVVVPDWKRAVVLPPTFPLAVTIGEGFVLRCKPEEEPSDG